jgi:hypothetical protein
MLFKFVLLEICLISYFLVFQTPLLRLEKKQIEVSHFGIFVTLCNVFFYICIEKIAPKLPEIYTEPYRVKHFNKDIFIRNSTIFSAAIDVSEHAIVMETLRQISRLLGDHGITWMITAGTLIGSLRHWDIIPWDDDFVTFWL